MQEINKYTARNRFKAQRAEIILKKKGEIMITYEEALEIAESLHPDEVYFILDHYYEDCELIRKLKNNPDNVRPAFIAHCLFGKQIEYGKKFRIRR